MHVAMNALDRAEQDESAIPDNAAAPLKTLQAELRRLDPLINEAESLMVRQAGQGVLRATAYQKAALAPALLETAGKSERFAYENLATEQNNRVGVEKALRVTERQLRAIQDQGTSKERRIDALNAELEATREHCSRLEVTAEPQPQPRPPSPSPSP